MGAAIKDVSTCLSWMGVSDIQAYPMKLMEGVVWEALSYKKKKQLVTVVKKAARAAIRPQRLRKSPQIALKFAMCRKLQQDLKDKGVDSADNRYWQAQGWIP